MWKRELKKILVLDIDDQNTTYVFASKHWSCIIKLKSFNNIKVFNLSKQRAIWVSWFQIGPLLTWSVENEGM